MVNGLDAPCPVCGRVSGDHTLREWGACLGTTVEDLPFAEVPADMARIINARIREQFGLDDDLLVADTVVVKSLVLDGSVGTMKVRTPALLHEFAIGRPGGPPAPVVRVLFVGPPDGMRSYGRLVRDSANGAVNAIGKML